MSQGDPTTGAFDGSCPGVPIDTAEAAEAECDVFEAA